MLSVYIGYFCRLLHSIAYCTVIKVVINPYVDPVQLLASGDTQGKDKSSYMYLFICSPFFSTAVQKVEFIQRIELSESRRRGAEFTIFRVQ